MADQRPGGGSPRLIQAEEGEFCLFRGLIKEKIGIDLKESKRDLLSLRLGARVRALGLGSFDEYYRRIRQDVSGKELLAALDAVSAAGSGFFGEAAHYKYLAEELAPAAARRAGSLEAKELRGWSAGCAFGEEAYSIAITLLECAAVSGPSWEIKILATDISQEALERAQCGEYPAAGVERVSARLLGKYFEKIEAEGGKLYRIKPQAAGLARFRRFNLTSEPFPFKRKFHFIFCLNAMIYFDKKTQQGLARRFYDALEPGGALLIGRSESLTGLAHGFKYAQPGVYLKPEPERPAA